VHDPRQDLIQIKENYGISQSRTKLLLKQTNSASIGG